MFGYKAFDENLRCRDFQYEIGQTYEINEDPVVCKRGFHFCENIGGCFSYYSFSDNIRICRIEALGSIDADDKEHKYCTNKMYAIPIPVPS